MLNHKRSCSDLIHVVIFLNLFLAFNCSLFGQTTTLPESKSRFINITEVSYSMGVGNVQLYTLEFENDDESFGFQTINGSLINEHLSLGIGLGYEKYNHIQQLPLFLEARCYLTKNKSVKPVFVGDFGYAFGLGSESGGGILLHPQVGLKVAVSEKVAYGVTVGLKFQQIETTRTFYDEWGNYAGTYHEGVYYDFLSIKMGCYF